jgi:hypothetical protein
LLLVSSDIIGDGGLLLAYVDFKYFCFRSWVFSNDLVLNSTSCRSENLGFPHNDLVPIYPTRIETVYGVLLIHPGISSTKLLVDRKSSGQ